MKGLLQVVVAAAIVVASVLPTSHPAVSSLNAAPAIAPPAAGPLSSFTILPEHEFNLRVFVHYLHGFKDPTMDELATWMLIAQSAAKKQRPSEYEIALKEAVSLLKSCPPRERDSLTAFIGRLPVPQIQALWKIGCCNVQCQFGSCRACGINRTCSCILGNPVCGAGGGSGWAGTL